MPGRQAGNSSPIKQNQTHPCGSRVMTEERDFFVSFLGCFSLFWSAMKYIPLRLIEPKWGSKKTHLQNMIRSLKRYTRSSMVAQRRALYFTFQFQLLSVSAQGGNVVIKGLKYRSHLCTCFLQLPAAPAPPLSSARTP